MNARPVSLPFISAVAGVSFCQEVVVPSSEGDDLIAVAVDDNEFDANAVEVRVARTGEVLGFIPSGIAPKLRATGARAWQCVITEVLRGDLTGLRIKVLQATDDVVDRYQDIAVDEGDNPYSI